MSFKQ